VGAVIEEMNNAQLFEYTTSLINVADWHRVMGEAATPLGKAVIRGADIAKRECTKRGIRLEDW
jgi:hypothetical protein